MNRTDLEHRIREAAWPAPPPELRARVLSAATAARSSVSAIHAVPDDAAVRMPAGALRRDLPRVAAMATVTVLLALGGCAGFDVWAGDGLRTQIARLEAKYGSLDERTVVVSDVPAGDNQALAVRAAAALVVPLRTGPPYLYDLRATSPVPPNLRAVADANRSAVLLARDIRFRQRTNWAVDYVRGQGEDYPPFPAIGLLSDALYVTALLHMEAGRTDDAADAIVSMLSVSASLRQEPDVIIQTNRIYGTRHTEEALMRLVTDFEPSGSALAELAHWLAENEAPDAMQQGLLREMRQVNGLFSRMENGEVDANLASFLYPTTWPAWPKPWLGPAARIGRPFVRMAHTRYLQYMEQLLEVHSAPGPRQAYPSPEFEATSRWALVDRLTEKFTGKNWYALTGDRLAAELAAAELGVALRRFKLDRGAYPDGLSALVPTYLERLPIDPYTGEPPIYVRRGAGFTLSAKGDGQEYSWRRPIEWNVAR